MGRRELRNEIRKAKREMWMDWIEEGKEVWDIARVCKNPFGMRERCGVLKDERATLMRRTKRSGKRS